MVKGREPKTGKDGGDEKAKLVDTFLDFALMPRSYCLGGGGGGGEVGGKRVMYSD